MIFFQNCRIFRASHCFCLLCRQPRQKASLFSLKRSEPLRGMASAQGLGVKEVSYSLRSLSSASQSTAAQLLMIQTQTNNSSNKQLQEFSFPVYAACVPIRSRSDRAARTLPDKAYLPVWQIQSAAAACHFFPDRQQNRLHLPFFSEFWYYAATTS